MRAFTATIIAAFLALAAPPALARYSEVNATLPNAQLVGEARYRVLAWNVFEAELWNATGAFSWDQPFALSLTYERAFTARALADRGLSEMRQRGAGTAAQLEPLRARLEACFADVRAGDRITGVSTSASEATFYYNGARRCTIEHPGFRRAFFGIWLDARGDQAAFSAQLRGG